MNAVRLPLSFDVAGLLDDLRHVADGEWVAHFNTGYYEGDWSGVALRSVDGDPQQIYPDPTANGRYADTATLARLPHVEFALAQFQCDLLCVRLLRLTAGSSIREHSDLRLGRSHGEVRIHVPIVTDPDVAFYLAGDLVPMRPGEAWYLDLELPHRVDNRSSADRVHLVVDCVMNDWLDRLLDAGLAEAADGDAPVSASPDFITTATITTENVIVDHCVDAISVDLNGADAESGDFTGAPSGSTELTSLDPMAQRLTDFIRSIGIVVIAGDVPEGSIVPGVRLERGALVVDPDRLTHPGDLLHEAGHLAVAESDQRQTMSGSAPADGGAEMAAIAWSYAAALHIGIDPAVVFHPAGYRGGSESLLANFSDGRFFGVPLLQWYGLTFDDEQARHHAVDPYPAMRAWVRTTTGG